MVIRAYLTTAFFMLILGIIGLATAGEITPSSLNVIFFTAFFPSILAGVLVFVGGKVVAAEQVKQAPAEKRSTAQNF
jgi:hypothetical protein